MTRTVSGGADGREHHTVDHLRTSSEDSRQVFPINHRMRPAYRGLTGVLGVLLVAAAVAGFVRAGDVPFFGDEGTELLGFSFNRGAALLWTVVGVALFGSALVGRNVVTLTAWATGALLLLLGVLSLALLRTEVNVLAYTVTDVIVTFAVGVVVLWSGMYMWTEPEERRARHRGRSALARDPRDSDVRRDPTLRHRA